MKKGYKQTEIGIIPEDWEVKKLSEISNKITDGEHITPIRSKSGYFLLSARNIQDGYIDTKDVDYVEENEYQRIKKRCNPEPGDILLSCSGTIGRTATVPVDFKCVLVRSAALLKTKKEIINNTHLKYCIQSSFMQKQIFELLNKGAQANLFLNHIEILKFPLPPLPEQTAIAEALSDTDELLTTLEKLIEKKKLIKKGTMQELLTGKKRLPGFEKKRGYRQTEVGLIPEDWDVKKLGEIGELTSSKRIFESEYVSNGIPFYRGKEISYLIERKKIEIEIFISESRYNELSSQFGVPEKNDILITAVGTLGNVYLIPNNNKFYFKDGNLILLRKIRNTDPKYLSIQLANYKAEIINNAIGSSQKALTIIVLGNQKIPLPSLPEQTAIAETLSDMDSEIEMLEKKLEKTKQIKQGMMQELLTGKTRLV